MSFFARLMSTYIPEILTRELDILAGTNPSKWMALRKLFTGRDPSEAERMSHVIDEMLAEAMLEFKRLAPELVAGLANTREDVFRGVDYGKQMLVHYFEERPDLPAPPEAPTDLTDPKKMAEDFLRAFGWHRPQ